MSLDITHQLPLPKSPPKSHRPFGNSPHCCSTAGSLGGTLRTGEGPPLLSKGLVQTSSLELCCPHIRKSTPLGFQWTPLRLWDWGIPDTPPSSSAHFTQGTVAMARNVAPGSNIDCTCSLFSQEPTGAARYQHCSSAGSHPKREGLPEHAASSTTFRVSQCVDHPLSLPGLPPCVDALAELKGTSLQPDTCRTPISGPLQPQRQTPPPRHHLTGFRNKPHSEDKDTRHKAQIIYHRKQEQSFHLSQIR